MMWLQSEYSVNFMNPKATWWFICRRRPVAFLWISVLIFNTLGCIAGAVDVRKKISGNFHDRRSEDIKTNNGVASMAMLNGVSHLKTEINNFGECHVEDKDCEKDRLGFEAIRSLHLLIDDDHNGNVDLSESDEFLRDELQYTDGFERQELFHNNDKLISVDDLWKTWKHSPVYNWTVDDMIEWLVQDVDLPQYSQVFYNFAIDGSVLPRLVNSTSPLLASLGIRNPVHKQKISLKAMDTILFGAPKRLHSYAKDVMLFLAILLAIGISWFACLHHRYSQTQVKKMMKDLEALQNAEDALKKLSKELADAEKPQSSMPQEKQDELRMLRQNSLRLKVPRLGSGDRSPSRQIRDNSPHYKREGELKLKQAEEELATLRIALSDAENRLEMQQLESQWSVPTELQAWLQLTYELEHVHFSAKRQAAERQLLVARDGCEKVRKRKQALFGALRMAHSNSFDDIDQSILDARAALEEVKQDLQERLHRWHTIEVLCCFPVISNPGLSTLKQILGRDSGGSTRIPSSLISPVTFEETDEDISTTDDSRASESVYNQIPERQRQQIFAWAHRSRHSYWTKMKNDDNRGSYSVYNQIPEKPREQIFAWAHRSRHSYWTKQKTSNENRESENLYNQIPEWPRQQIFAWAHRSRLNNWMKKKTVTNGHTSPTGPAQSKTATFLKQLTPTASTGSLPHMSKVTFPTNSGGGNVKGESVNGELHESSSGILPATTTAGHTKNSGMFHLGDSSNHERSHSSASLSHFNPHLTNGNNHHGHVQAKTGFNHGIAVSSVLHISSSSGNLLPNKTAVKPGNSNVKMYTSASGNHLLAKANHPQSNAHSTSAAHDKHEAKDEKLQRKNSGDKLNNNKLSPDLDVVCNSEHAEITETSCESPDMLTQPHLISKHQENAETDSLGSVPRNHSKSKIGSSPKQDHTSLGTDSLNGSSNGVADMSLEKRKGKKKTLLPKFFQKNKKKAKYVN